MKNPIIVVNFKTYKSGKEALKMAKALEKVDKNIIVGVQADDIFLISSKTKLKVYAQHVDPMEPGRNTGFVTPKSVKTDGAEGTFLNHSEHKLSFIVLKKTVEMCKKIGLKTLIFASNLGEAKKVQKLKPNYLVIEPLELVAGDVSVSEAKPEFIKKISKELKGNFLVGAGIKNYKDVKIAMKFGASGVAVSSAITKTKNPGKKLRELMR